MRAIFYLPASDVRGFLPFLFRDEILEEPRANHIGALADDQRTIVLIGLDQFESRIIGPTWALGQRAWARPDGALHQDTNVFGSRPAAASHQIQPAVIEKAAQLRAQCV